MVLRFANNQKSLMFYPLWITLSPFWIFSMNICALIIGSWDILLCTLWNVAKDLSSMQLHSGMFLIFYVLQHAKTPKHQRIPEYFQKLDILSGILSTLLNVIRHFLKCCQFCKPWKTTLCSCIFWASIFLERSIDLPSLVHFELGPCVDAFLNEEAEMALKCIYDNSCS